MLLRHTDKIDFNAKDKHGETAFINACRRGHQYIVKLLLDHPNAGIEFNARDKNGNTAFIHACFGGHNDIVELLKSKPNLIQDA